MSPAELTLDERLALAHVDDYDEEARRYTRLRGRRAPKDAPVQPDDLPATSSTRLGAGGAP